MYIKAFQARYMEERIWILMGKKFSASLTPEEEEELNRLLQEQPEVQYAVEVLQSCWPMHMTEAVQACPDEEEEELCIEDVRAGRKMNRVDWLGIAILSFLFMMGVGIYEGFIVPLSRPVASKVQSEKGYNQIITRYGSRTHVVLPDGSEVWLNAGSVLSYGQDLAQSATREVNLQGEAYFIVRHDDRHPFVIHTRDMDIRDLGTVFNVKAYPDDPTTEATLLSGSIEVTLKQNDHHIRLKPHEKIVWFRDRDSLALHVPPSPDSIRNVHYVVQEIHRDRKYRIYPETAWLDNRMIFENESFAELAREMERRYAVQIYICCEDIAQTPLTGSFTDETLQQALDELRLITHFSYQIVGHEVFIHH